MMMRGFWVACDGKRPSTYLDPPRMLDCHLEFDGMEWTSAEAWDRAQSEGWKKVKKKHYCPDCVARKVWKDGS